MHTLTNAPKLVKLFGAALALTLLATAALAVALTTGPAQAQDPRNVYDDPQPCGPGAAPAYQPEPHEVSEGHFALFDGYWQWRSQDPINVGVLHTNLCPPLVTQTTETDPFGQPIGVITTLTDSGIDVEVAIIHVLDEHQATVVDGNPDDLGDRELPGGQFVEFFNDEHTNPGDEVWWLRLDDPNTDVVETSDLTLGFSTKRFDDQYWATDDGAPPFRFMFELERDPGIDPNKHPHFFAYRAREKGAAEAELVWSSAAADVNDLKMEAGQLEDLQWIFTQPGTYELSVHLQGWVHHPDPGENWQPISEYETETSEVKRYVIQVGSALTEVEPPRFGVNRSVDENSPAGTQIGDPISVFQTEVDTLEYRLSGEGHDQFDLVPATNPHSVQIVVADGAQLDYETRPAYDLTLGVTDNVDHESNSDDSLDDTLAVRIEVTDVVEPFTASLFVDNSTPALGESIVFTIAVEHLPAPADDFHFTWSEHDQGGGHSVTQAGSRIPQTFQPAIIPEEAVVREYYITLWTMDDQNQQQNKVRSNLVTVTWGNP